MAAHFTLVAGSIATGLFVGMLAMIEIGRRSARRRAALQPEGGREGLGGAEGAVYGLFGLLLAFSFSGAASRFEHRRTMLIEEANAIGTAYLRLDLLPPEAQPPVRDAFRKYFDSRLEAYRKLPDMEAAQAELARSVVLQHELWSQVIAAIRAHGVSPQGILPPLNEMFDIAAERTARAEAHPPFAIFGMLLVLALVSALMVGFGMAFNKGRNLLHEVAYAAVLSSVIYVIVDLEFPRLGMIRIDSADQVLYDVRQQMK